MGQSTTQSQSKKVGSQAQGESVCSGPWDQGFSRETGPHPLPRPLSPVSPLPLPPDPWAIPRIHLHTCSYLLPPGTPSPLLQVALSEKLSEKSIRSSYLGHGGCCLVAKSHVTLCDPKDCTTPGLLVLH